MRYIQTIAFLSLGLWNGLVMANQSCLSESELASSTPTSQFVIHGDGTVTDKKSGLMWKQCSEGQSGSDCSVGSAIEYSWDDALLSAQNSTTANYNDWRLPNHKELFTLVEHRCFKPSINLSVFPLGQLANEYSEMEQWTSTIFDDHFTRTIEFTDGTTTGKNRQTVYHSVRLVRSGSIPQPLTAYQAFRNDFMPLTRHEKCINCHEMAKRNDTWTRHINEGRITVFTDVAFDDEVCAACHTSNTGFADHWRAPGDFFTPETLLTSTTTAENACKSLNRLTDPYHHLSEDELILWAIEQMEGVTHEDWIKLIDTMRTPFSRNFTCDPPN